MAIPVRSYRRQDGTYVRAHTRRGWGATAGAALVGVVVVGLALTGGDEATTPPGNAPSSSARVVDVVDGDTIRVRTNGQTRRVRLLGIDAPEAPSEKPGECYHREATAMLRALLPAGTTVTLVTDPTQADQDVYDRLLRYVDLNGSDVGRTLIQQGAAEARNDEPPTRRLSVYTSTESAARSDDVGLWGACR